MRFFPILIITFSFFLNVDSQAYFDSEFVISYLKNLKVKMCYFLTCWRQKENIQLIQMLQAANLKYCFPKFTKNSLEPKKLTHYVHILDMTCDKFKSLLNEKTTKTLFKLTHPWLIFTNASISELSEIFDPIYLRMDSNVKVVLPGNELGKFEILDVYNPGLQIGQKGIMTEYGSWNGSFLFKNEKLNFYLQRKNMSQMQLRSASVVLVSQHSGTFQEYIVDTRHKEMDPMSKFHYPLFLLLEDYHNFSHTVQVEDKWFGNYQNGTDAGVGRLLYQDLIDVTCTGASQRPPRIDVYEYLMPSYHFRPCYVFRNPGTHDPLTNEFLKPFDHRVWYLVVLSAALICILLQIFHRTENKFVGSKSKYSWATAILTTSAIIFQQDSSVFPTGIGGRLIFLILQVLSILLYNYYTSSIISFLLSKPPEAFHTLHELGRSKLEIGIEDLPFTLTWFEIMNDSDVQYIYKNKVLRSGNKLNIYIPEEGIAKVGRGGFAYHTLLDTAYPIIAKTFDQDAICDVKEIAMIPQVTAGLMLQKNSQYKELFHITLRLIKQAGLVHRLSQIWESKKPECLSTARVMAVGIEQVFIAFLGLFFGIILSLLILAIEIVWFKMMGSLQK